MKEYNQRIEELRAMLPVGSTISTILRHVAKSGMMRVVLPIINGERIPYIEELTIFKYNAKHDGYTIPGCGTDAGFELVYNLSSAVYKDGFDCIGGWDYSVPRHERKPCPSSDHVNLRNGEPMPTHHKDGGYAIGQRWI
jgi:hypothetical protein